MLRRPSPALAVAFAALLVALGGTSFAAFNLPKNSVGTKQLKNNAVTTKKIKNGTVTASKINTSGLSVPRSQHASSADMATNATNAANATNATNAANATNATNATNANHAGNSDQLGGQNPNDYGAVLSGRINSLMVGSNAGYPSGVSLAGVPSTSFQMLSPNHDLTARNFSVQLTAAPGTGKSRTFYLVVNGALLAAALTCGPISGSATSCNTGAATEAVPASSTMLIEEQNTGSPTGADALFALRLTL